MNTEQMREALTRRMDAYLSGQSAEATAIIKDARDLLTAAPQAPADALSFAGMCMWLGNKRITRHLTEIECKHAFSLAALFNMHAIGCVNQIAAMSTKAGGV